MITATLENWHIDYIGISSFYPGSDNFRIIGHCYGDVKGRFIGGEVICTSLITKYNSDDGNVETLNGVYKLGNPLSNEEVARLKELTA